MHSSLLYLLLALAIINRMKKQTHKRKNSICPLRWVRGIPSPPANKKVLIIRMQIIGSWLTSYSKFWNPSRDRGLFH